MTSEFKWPIDPAAMERAKTAMDVFIREMRQIGEELTQFASKRGEADVAAWNRLAKSKTFQDALVCQHEFIETATTQYLDEFNRFSHAVIEMTNHVLAASKPHDERSSHGRG